MDNEITPFDILKKSINFKDIFQVYPHQQEVLEKYDSIKDKDNVVIESPTGSGKSFILLAIAEYWRQKKKKVCVLSQNKQLVSQLKKEADRLKFESVVIYPKRDQSEEANSNLRKYSLKNAFGITNHFCFFYHELDADILIFDDSHLLEDTLDDFFTIRLRNGTDECKLIEKFLVEKEIVTSDDLRDIYKNDGIKLLNFKQEEVVIPFITQELSKLRDDSGDLFWSYYWNKNYLKNYLVFISSEGIFLTPFVKPLSMVEQVRKIKKKIFLSATIPSKDQLVLSLGLQDEPEILRYRSLKTSDYNKLTVGNRLILPYPNLINLDLDNPRDEFIDRKSRQIELIVSNFNKVLVLCRSFGELDSYFGFLKNKISSDKIIITSRDKNFYEKFIEANKAVLILANRYSGLDFPGESCNVAILTSIPSRCTPEEIFVEDELHDKPFSEEKTAIRIVQAFGRCNRSKTDIGIYFVLDGTYYFDFIKMATFSKFYPPNVTDEVNQGIDLYEQAKGDKLNFLIILAQKFLKEPQILELRKLAEHEPPHNDQIGFSLNLVKSWNFIMNNNYNDSRDILRYSINNMVLSEEYKCWFYYLMAKCEYYLNEKKVNETAVNFLKEASRRHASKFFGEVYKLYSSLEHEHSAKSPQYNYFSKHINELFEKDKNLINIILDIKINLESGDHDKICGGITKLLTLFGINIKNLSIENKSDLDLKINDVLHNRGYIIEVKAKPESKTISSADIGQIKKHMESKYEKEFTEVYFILLTKKELKIEEDAKEQFTQIARQNIEDYIKLVNDLMVSITDKEKFKERVVNFYEVNFLSLN